MGYFQHFPSLTRESSDPIFRFTVTSNSPRTTNGARASSRSALPSITVLMAVGLQIEIQFGFLHAFLNVIPKISTLTIVSPFSLWPYSA